MTKTELIDAIHERIGTSKTTIAAVLASQAAVVTFSLSRLARDEVTLPGLGKLKLAGRAARTGRNPQTGEAVEIAARNTVKFVPAKALKDAVNE
jgi:DNA-binding protein HU-beta